MIVLNNFAFANAVTTPAFVAAGSPDATAGGSVAPTYPASVQTNDILFLYVITNSPVANPTISTPAGWTAVSSYHSTATDVATALFWRRAAGGESGTVTVSFSASVSASGVGYGVISQWRGCVTSGDPYERSNSYSQGVVQFAQGKGLRTSGTNRRAVSFCASIGGTPTGTNTNGWTEDFHSSTLQGPDAALTICSIDKAVAGRVEPLKRSLSALQDCFITHTVALIPVGGTPGSADAYANVLYQLQPSGSNGSTTFTDESYYDHRMTVAGNAQMQSGKLDLDGTGDWIALDGSSRPLFRFKDDANTASTDFTIDVFGAEVDTLASTQTLISFWTSGGGVNERCWFLFVSTAGNVTLQYATSGGTTLTLINYAAGITTGVSHNYRIVRSISAGEVYLYIDGTKVATATLSGATLLFDATTGLVVGSASITTTPPSMNGRIAAARITKSALSTGASYTVETLPLATS